MITFWLDGHALARLDNGRWHTRCDATLPDSDRITDQQPADPCTRCSADIARRAEAALSAVVDLGTLPPTVHLAIGGEFGPVGEFTANQIRTALAADGVTWEAS
jgi:hypothetical protein